MFTCHLRQAHRRPSVGMTASLWSLVLLIMSGVFVEGTDSARNSTCPPVTASLQSVLEHWDRSSTPPPAGIAGFKARLENLESRWENSTRQSTNEWFLEFNQLQREILLSHPILSSRSILFVVRQQYAPDHHNTATFFPKARTEYNDGAFRGGSSLKAIDLADSGKVRTLLDLPQGVVRDPDVHFDGQRILFSMRRGLEDSYHVYEIKADGSGLKQLTFAEDVDDLDPIYLPEDSIVFASTREPKYCMCNRHIMANLYRMDADGANIHQIGKSTLFEGHPSLLPDGRILYDRWEYVDRNFGDAQGLWTVYPDGSNPAVYWGNNTASPGAVLEARIIPGTQRAICMFGSCHDRPWGALAVVDRSLGLDGRPAVVRTWPADAVNLVQQTGWEQFDRFTSVKLKYEDPYPLDDHFFLCARMTGKGEQTGLYLIDLFGNEILLHAELPGCFDPMMLAPRPCPTVLPDRRDFTASEGTFYVANVYEGTPMGKVPPGSAKYLRVVESPEKRFWTRPPWGGQGQEAPAMSWHDFNNKRILGTVPVEKDGSAYFQVPAETFVYFQLLDERGMLIQSMRSGTMVQAGERAGCTGCHEDRRQAPPPTLISQPLALKQPPRILQEWYGAPRLFNYLAEVQPVFSKHCVRCHDYGREADTRLNLAPDRDLVFNASYNELWRKKLIHAIGAGPSDIQPAYSWGSPRSRLVEYLRPVHYQVQLSHEEFDRVVTWIDINAPYYPSYASAYPTNLAGRAPLTDGEMSRLEALTGVPLRRQASFTENQGPQVSFDRPQLSPCLKKITDPERHAEALALIDSGRQRLALRPEADHPDFVACEMDQWRESNYQARRKHEQNNRQSIRAGQKHYDYPGSDAACQMLTNTPWSMAHDWLLQDTGLIPASWLSSGKQVPKTAILKVLDELGAKAGSLREILKQYESSGITPQDRPWLALYLRACELRRQQRLETLRQRWPRIVFTRHYNLGGSHYAYTEGQSDAQHERHFVPGAALCLLELDDKAHGQVKTLMEDKNGVIRDPDVSWDGKRILFSWKKSDRGDDYHLYEMDSESGQIRQITSGLGFADYEGSYLPSGDIIFNSTRCVQTVDCWWTEVSNLYTCDANGRYLRRLTFDQVHDNYPTITPDGRILYTRWEYSDRGQIFVQGLFQMNPDGTGQSEFYGNNSWFPTSLLHARGIPDSTKVVAIFSGHHTIQMGKLGLIDVALGRQENSGAQLIAPVRQTRADRIDAYGQEGDLFQYPYPLNEREFVVAFAPLLGAQESPRFGIYWMAADGRRELLAIDSSQSCNQPVPLAARLRPPVRPSVVDYAKSNGTYYIQDIYEGPGLAGVARGEVERLRVVALEWRAAGMGWNYNQGPAGDALVCTPVSIGNGAWDPKTILGEAEVYSDGSAFFTVPARTPVYFQAIDRRGNAVQTMRSWTTLQPGENASCIGCHESKNSTPLTSRPLTQALRIGPRELEPFHGMTGSFSFRRDLQPILDRHCVRCHDATHTVNLTGETVAEDLAKRAWTRSYLTLVNARKAELERQHYWAGVPNDLVNWISAQSEPSMLPPYSQGAARSRLMDLLQKQHEGAVLSKPELAIFAAWIDLLVPYCGDYLEANTWTAEEKARYEHFVKKRQTMEQLERKEIEAFITSRQAMHSMRSR